jgi:hypothetical protein
LLAGLDLRLAPQCLSLAFRILDQLSVDPSRLADTRRAEHLHREQDEHGSDCDPGGNCDPDVHVRRTSLGWVHPARHCARLRIAESRSVPGAQLVRAVRRPPYFAVGLPLDRVE